jgi:hypothetical protein
LSDNLIVDIELGIAEKFTVLARLLARELKTECMLPLVKLFFETKRMFRAWATPLIISVLRILYGHSVKKPALLFSPSSVPQKCNRYYALLPPVANDL